MAALNTCVKYRGVEKPHLDDISDIGRSVSSRSFFASLMRSSFM